jgi:hydroxyacylglutathione hydrolase
MQIKTFVFNPFSENTYLVWNEPEEAIIIDPGMSSPEEEVEFNAHLQDNKLRIKHCILTHAHIDHILGCDWIFKQFGLKPIMHPEEQIVYKSGKQVALMYGVGAIELPEYFLFGVDDEELSFGSVRFKMYFTPGHSPGSLSFYSEEDKVLFSGDVLFEGSIGRTDLPGGDFDTLINSIKTQLLPLPNETKVYSGHGGMTTIGQEKLTNPFL